MDAAAYAIGDVVSQRHSLHTRPSAAKGFYGVYFGLILVTSALVVVIKYSIDMFTSLGGSRS